MKFKCEEEMTENSQLEKRAEEKGRDADRKNKYGTKRNTFDFQNVHSEM